MICRACKIPKIILLSKRKGNVQHVLPVRVSKHILRLALRVVDAGEHIAAAAPGGARRALDPLWARVSGVPLGALLSRIAFFALRAGQGGQLFRGKVPVGEGVALVPFYPLFATLPLHTLETTLPRVSLWPLRSGISLVALCAGISFWPLRALVSCFSFFPLVALIPLCSRWNAEGQVHHTVPHGLCDRRGAPGVKAGSRNRHVLDGFLRAYGKRHLPHHVGQDAVDLRLKLHRL